MEDFSHSGTGFLISRLGLGMVCLGLALLVFCGVIVFSNESAWFGLGLALVWLGLALVSPWFRLGFALVSPWFRFGFDLVWLCFRLGFALGDTSLGGIPRSLIRLRGVVS